MNLNLEDTIAAIATPLKASGIGILRISGKNSLEILLKLAPSLKTRNPEPRHAYNLGIINPLSGGKIDDAVAIYFIKPHSYTGEDVVEFYCHGSPAILQKLLETILMLGCRQASQGEFTRRAFLNGKMDLLQAEAVIDLINAEHDAALGCAFSQLSGDLGGKIREIQESITEILTKIEAAIDFSEEDLPDFSREELIRETDHAAGNIKSLVDSFRAGRILKNGFSIAICGRPNTGKSSIFNALLNYRRAIVTPQAGTTRDFITEKAVFNGMPFILIDTAGIRESSDQVEISAVNKTMECMKEADLALLVFDRSMPAQGDDKIALNAADQCKVLILLNKSDLEDRFDRNFLPEHLEKIEISAVSLKNFDLLKEIIVNKARAPVDEISSGMPVITRIRHRDLLQKSLDSLQTAVCQIKNDESGEIIALSLREAMDALGEMIGHITTEDILDRIFSEFCIGK
jgi:tRNA modification GTPase